MRIGILVQAVVSNDRFEAGNLEPPLASAGVANRNYIKGIYSGKVTILDMNTLLEDPSLIVNETV